MSNVSLHIGGRDYTVACADGQEDHIAGLGKAIDAKLATMGGTTGQSEVRSLLFAALLMADEAFELKSQGGAAAGPAADSGPDPAPSLEALADRLEKLAAHLEG